MIPSTLWIAVIAAVLSFGTAWEVQDWRWESKTLGEEVQSQKAEIGAEKTNRSTESQRSTNVIEAQNAQSKRTQSLAADAAASRAVADGLRSDLHAARTELSSRAGDACTNDATASSQLLAAMEAGINQLASAGEDLAGKADGHASDTMTLQQAWPKDKPDHSSP